MDDRVRCPENPGRLGGCGSRVGGGAEGLACRVTCLACPMLAHAVGLPVCLWGMKWAAVRGSLGPMVAYLARSSLESGD